MSDATEQRVVYERLRGPPSAGPTDLTAARRRYSDLAAGFELAPDVRIEEASIGGLPGEWVRSSRIVEDGVLLYLHGGGYITGSPRPYRSLVAELGRGIGIRALAIDYRLAPEHPFPAAIEDSVRTYEWLLTQKLEPNRLVIAGDSAGGGLTMATLIKLRESGVPLPAAVWLVSPWVDLSLAGESLTTHDAVEPRLHRAGLEACARLYLNGALAKDPLASPLYADLSGLPPIRIDVGAHETLLDDSLRLARHASEGDVSVQLHIWPRMVHMFPFFAPILEEGRTAIAQAAAFLRHQLLR